MLMRIIVKTAIVPALGTTMLGLSFCSAIANPTLNEQGAHADAVAAYIYLYPLVTMDLTRAQMTNVVTPRGFQAPMNAFVNVAAYPTADMKIVVRPNFDTLYSSAWIDLTKGPVIISAPDMHGRYYMLPMMDMWTDVFASPGSRTTGTQAGDYALVPPGWNGAMPDGVARVDAPTPFVWIIGRIKTDGPADYDAVHALQDKLRITPLARWGNPPEAAVGIVDPAVDMATLPKTVVDTMTASEFFSRATDILGRQPAHITDGPMLALMKRIGIEPGRSFDLDGLAPDVKAGLMTAPADGLKLMAWKVPTIGRVINGWSMNTETMGVYGNDYLKRAIVANMGLGANLPEDAVYPINLADQAGKPLDGASDYTLHFAKGAAPPVDAFWSVTLYDAQGYQVANEQNRFALSSWMPFKPNVDGSLDLYVQNADPGVDKHANWLPAPKGAFNLLMRLYGPKNDVLTGRWNPSPVVMAATAPSRAAE